MKAELKTEEDEQEKERKRKEKLEKIEAAAADRKKKQKRVLTTNDRLLDDKVIFIIEHFFCTFHTITFYSFNYF